MREHIGKAVSPTLETLIQKKKKKEKERVTLDVNAVTAMAENEAEEEIQNAMNEVILVEAEEVLILITSLLTIGKSMIRSMAY